MNQTFDVAVIGAGCAGLCAAIQSGRAGAKTILIEKNGICGGTLTMCGINYPGIFNAWGKQVIGGIGWELVRKTLEETGEALPDFSNADMSCHWRHQIRINPVVFAALADRALLDAGVEIRFHTMPGKIERNGGVWNLTLCDKDGLYELQTKVVIDCTGDANAVKMAGYAVNQPDSCQPGTLSIYATGYDVDQLDFPALEKAFDEALNAGELVPEDMGWSKRFNRGFFYGHGGNSNHVCGINAADSEGRTRMEIAGRESILRIYRFLHRQAGLENLEFRFGSGECGVRETWTIVGEKTVTVEDYVSGRIFDDAVCFCYYPVDLHDAKLGLDKRDLAPGVVPTIPLGALIPRDSKGFLAAGRILSSDRLANSALRVQAPCMATGQAAGAAAALCAQSGMDPANLPFENLRKLLLKHDAILP